MLSFRKYHGLGNDYLVMEPGEFASLIVRGDFIRLVCDCHFGFGSDGILVGPYGPDSAEAQLMAGLAGIDVAALAGSLGAVRIFNPDGSEAEKSGNGLRIFSRFLYDTGRVALDQPFRLVTLGGLVQSRIMDSRQDIRIDMGHVSFNSLDIPATGPECEMIGEAMEFGGRVFPCCNAANIGNPHCVVVCEEISAGLAKSVGPLIENDARFPRRTNVQFMKKLDEHAIAIEIWERGAGYTLASGSSASASAAVAIRLGLCSSPVEVRMPGGTLHVEADAGFQLRQRGPVAYIGSGELDDEFLAQF